MKNIFFTILNSLFTIIVIYLMQALPCYCKIGYIDKTGKVRINLDKYAFNPLQLFYKRPLKGSIMSLEPFFNKRALVYIYDETVELKRTISFIDTKGKLLNVRFIDAKSFSQNLAAVEIKNKWGFIDLDGNIVIKPIFDYALPFSEDLAPVKLKDKWGYIDLQGNIVIKPQFDNAIPFHEDRAVIKFNNLIGFINKEGEIIVQPKYKTAYSFSDGLAFVSINKYPDKAGYCYINSEGAEVIKISANNFTWDKMSHSLYKKSIHSITARGHAYCFRIGQDSPTNINYYRGITLVNEIEYFSEGLAPVQIKNKFGYIDKIGKVVIKPLFDAAAPFSEGLACVSVEGKVGYIDKTGNYVIKPQFYYGRPFSNGCALTEDSKGRCTYIDKTGKSLFNRKLYDKEHEVDYSFSEGYAGFFNSLTPYDFEIDL